MKQLGSLFEVYKKRLRPPQSSVETEALLVIKQVTGITLKKGQVVYQPGSRTLSLQAPSIVRTEVLKQKAAVLAALSASLGATHAPHDLR